MWHNLMTIKSPRSITSKQEAQIKLALNLSEELYDVLLDVCPTQFPESESPFYDLIDERIKLLGLQDILNALLLNGV